MPGRWLSSLPALWNEKRDVKRAKLLQYAERVWNITDGSDNERIDAAIAATRHFFEQMGVPTRLSDLRSEWQFYSSFAGQD